MSIDGVTLESLKQHLTHLDVRHLKLRGKCMKLSDSEVLEIRALEASKLLSRKRLAELYQVHTSSISDIISRRTRADI